MRSGVAWTINFCKTTFTTFFLFCQFYKEMEVRNLLIINKGFYYMAGSAIGQDESNPALRLATRAGKMELLSRILLVVNNKILSKFRQVF